MRGMRSPGAQRAHNAANRSAHSGGKGASSARRNFRSPAQPLACRIKPTTTPAAHKPTSQGNTGRSPSRQSPRASAPTSSASASTRNTYVLSVPGVLSVPLLTTTFAGSTDPPTTTGPAARAATPTSRFGSADRASAPRATVHP